VAVQLRLLRAALPALVGLLAVGCGDVGVAGVDLSGDGRLRLYADRTSPDVACIERQVERIADAYRAGRLAPIRVRIDAGHPRFLAVAASERAEFELSDGTRLLLPLHSEVAAAVSAGGTHRLLEIPVSIALATCLEAGDH
jgi:hypothetical protein